MSARLAKDLVDLMLIPGLSGHESKVAKDIRNKLATIERLGGSEHIDRAGNLICTLHGDPDSPSVMVFAHMDQLGFIVRKIDDNGLISLSRLGGVPERTLASQQLLFDPPGREPVLGITMNTSHHATPVGEAFRVTRVRNLKVDTGRSSKNSVREAGIEIGCPVVYRPNVIKLAAERIAGTSIDDRAGCAVMLELARKICSQNVPLPTVHLVFSVQEEFNLRGAVVAANALKPDIAIQIDLMLACDTPDLSDLGEMSLGGGPGMSLYSFHGRGTLNGVIPHPRLVELMERSAKVEGIPLQRSAQVGVLTDLSYVQTIGNGIAGIDVGFPLRHTHSPLECADMRDLHALAELLFMAIRLITPDLRLERDTC